MRRAGGLWLRERTAFAALSPRRARVALALAAALVLACFLALRAPGPAALQSTEGMSGAAAASAAAEDRADVLLYLDIVSDLRAGEPYYDAAARELRQDGYPLRPFFTFRLPTLAIVQAALPDVAAIILLFALAAATVIAWFVRLAPRFARVPPRLVAALLVVGGLSSFIRPDLVAFHEVWAAPLIALSLALWRPGRAGVAIAIGLIAMMVRETAALYAGLMALIALAEGRRREAAGWAIAIAAFLVAVAAHAWAVGQVVRPLDLASPGWLGLLGFGFFVKVMTLATALSAIPAWAAAPLVGAALVGWASWRDPLATRALATVAGYALLLALLCRTDTYYWGLLPAPLLLVGLAFAPDAWRDLVTSALDLDRRRITVTRVVR